jgi:hypothetical protein
MKILIVLLALITVYTAKAETANNSDTVPDGGIDNEDYLNYGISEGIVIYGESQEDEFPVDSIEYEILYKLNSSLTDREQFIENDLLKDAGIRNTANVKFRKTTNQEKLLSLWHGIARILSFGIIPMRPFSEIEYAELADGEYYNFDSIIYAGRYKNVSPEIRRVMELEYMLQIEFCNGIVIQNNVNYYSEENICKFKNLTLSLPETPNTLKNLKYRYLNIELPKIQAALERYKNPDENTLRYQQNLGDSFMIYKNK